MTRLILSTILALALIQPAYAWRHQNRLGIWSWNYGHHARLHHPHVVIRYRTRIVYRNAPKVDPMPVASIPVVSPFGSLPVKWEAAK